MKGESYRAQLSPRARQMRAEGLKLREIGERLGVSTSAIGEWCVDPDRAKHRARRMKYAGECVDCGKPTDGSHGPGRAPERCNSCASAKSGREQAWPRYEQVAKMRAEGLLNTEIAARLGISRFAVGSLVYQARECGFEIARTAYGPSRGRAMR